MSKNSDFHDEDMREEYDFSGGIRGKHVREMHEGYTISIKNEDGTITQKVVGPSKNVVLIEDDLLEFFPDSDSVNHALRTLVSLFPEK